MTARYIPWLMLPTRFIRRSSATSAIGPKSPSAARCTIRGTCPAVAGVYRRYRTPSAYRSRVRLIRTGLPVPGLVTSTSTGPFARRSSERATSARRRGKAARQAASASHSPTTPKSARSVSRARVRGMLASVGSAPSRMAERTRSGWRRMYTSAARVPYDPP